MQREERRHTRGNLDEMSMKTHTHTETHTQPHTCPRVELSEESSLFRAQGRAAQQRDGFFFALFLSISCNFFHSFPLAFFPFCFCFFFRSLFRSAFVLFFFLFLFVFQCEFWFLWQTKTSLNRLCTRCDALARLRSNSDNSVSWKSFALARALFPIPYPSPAPMLQPPALPAIAALLSLCSTSHSPTHTHTHTHPNSSVQHENFRCCLVSCPSHTHRHRHSRKHRNLRAALALLSFTENLLLVCTHTRAHKFIYTCTYVCGYKRLFIYISHTHKLNLFLLNCTVILESLLTFV